MPTARGLGMSGSLVAPLVVRTGVNQGGECAGRAGAAGAGQRGLGSFTVGVLGHPSVAGRPLHEQRSGRGVDPVRGSRPEPGGVPRRDAGYASVPAPVGLVALEPLPGGGGPAPLRRAVRGAQLGGARRSLPCSCHGGRTEGNTHEDHRHRPDGHPRPPRLHQRQEALSRPPQAYRGPGPRHLPHGRRGEVLHRPPHPDLRRHLRPRDRRSRPPRRPPPSLRRWRRPRRRAQGRRQTPRSVPGIACLVRS
jgi:hypothetical protein